MNGRMDLSEGFIAVDWGTTNRRAYRIDGSGACAGEFEDGQGVLSVPAGGFPDAVAEVRGRLGDLPLLMGGMIGSNRGWVEARYVPCPAGFEDLAAGLARPGAREAIVPGVSYLGDGRADVMRGEEVQLLGAVSDSDVPGDALVCHPGTHNKWVDVRDAKIVSFRTVMTGELFSLLKKHSILSDLLGTEVEPGEAFDRGVAHALDQDDLPSELFAVRARVLLGQAQAKDASSYASGLLIGTDVRIGLSTAQRELVHVMGRPDLTRLYAVAIRRAGREAVELDGEESFLDGIRRIAERIAQ
jgi:2-dehydro-3-deoxygalactonokinase